MSNRPAQVTTTEIKRTVKGALEAGLVVGRVEVDHRTGKVVVWPAGAVEDQGDNPCDELLK